MDQPQLQPLILNLNANSIEDSKSPHAATSQKTLCLICDKSFHLSDLTSQAEFFTHIGVEHKLVIGDIKLIADLVQCVNYWRERFKVSLLEEFCSVIKTNSSLSDKAPSEYYFLLCDLLPEDKQIREKLQKNKLSCVLRQQQIERDDTSFDRGCLFCREHFLVNRSDLFNHMKKDHNFSIGLPDNLVFVNELLDKLQEKLTSLKCLYCEKTFKDRHILKEHMRKKQHKKINAHNPVYDKYYVINYLELGKNWENFSQEPDSEQTESGSDPEEKRWGDWTDDSGATAVCLFCDHASSLTADLQLHMKETHSFDMICACAELNFYQQIKLINYIRRRVYQTLCISCDQTFDSRQSLLEHLSTADHFIPPTSHWDQPQYYFPTYEDDALLCNLNDASDVTSTYPADEIKPRSDHHGNEESVIAEPLPAELLRMREESVLNQLVK